MKGFSIAFFGERDLEKNKQVGDNEEIRPHTQMRQKLERIQNTGTLGVGVNPDSKEPRTRTPKENKFLTGQASSVRDKPKNLEN